MTGVFYYYTVPVQGKFPLLKSSFVILNLVSSLIFKINASAFNCCFFLLLAIFVRFLEVSEKAINKSMQYDDFLK